MKLYNLREAGGIFDRKETGGFPGSDDFLC